MPGKGRRAGLQLTPTVLGRGKGTRRLSQSACPGAVSPGRRGRRGGKGAASELLDDLRICAYAMRHRNADYCGVKLVEQLVVAPAAVTVTSTSTV